VFYILTKNCLTTNEKLFLNILMLQKTFFYKLHAKITVFSEKRCPQKPNLKPRNLSKTGLVIVKITSSNRNVKLQLATL
jgi:hypothetical protein